MLKTILLVGAGSALGGIARYVVSRWFQSLIPVAFPWGTFVVNVVGCFLIGLIYGLADRNFPLSPEMKVFLTVGFCGGFTTFSTFIHEGYLLFGTSNLTVILYGVASLAAGLLCAHLGHFLVQ